MDFRSLSVFILKITVFVSYLFFTSVLSQNVSYITTFFLSELLNQEETDQHAHVSDVMLVKDSMCRY